MNDNPSALFTRLSVDCYVATINGKFVEINQLPDGAWAWAVNEVGYDAENSLEDAQYFSAIFAYNSK